MAELLVGERCAVRWPSTLFFIGTYDLAETAREAPGIHRTGGSGVARKDLEEVIVRGAARCTKILRVVSLATGLALGCSGTRGNSSPPTTVSVGPLCVTHDPGPSPLRRLTRTEYAETVAELLGPGVIDGSRLPPGERALGFDNNADVISTSDLLVDAYEDLAEKAGDAVAANLAAFAPCAASAPDTGCANQFIADFGRLAWRRPLTADEQTALAAVFTEGTAAVGFGEGIARVTAVLLASPQFLYRVEVGAGPAADLPNAVALAPNELATRLSYLVWGGMPDPTLRAAADGGRLSTPADLERESRRMLADPRAHAIVATFHAQWMGMDRLGGIDKDAILYPAYTPALAGLFVQESARFVDEVVWNREGTLAALLTAPYTFGDATLAAFYGAAPPAAGGFDLIRPDPTRRAGFLTEGGFLALYGKANQSDPVHRGRFVRERMLCTTLPLPPQNVVIRAPDLDPRSTTRQRFDQHTADPMCGACHALLDPIGFGFEHYDGIGRWRDMEGGQPVDGSGALTGTDVDGAFDGAVALGAKLAASTEVEVCYATQWFRFGYGRGETAADACTLHDLATAFAASKGNVRELLVALTQTEAFRYRRAGDLP